MKIIRTGFVGVIKSKIAYARSFVDPNAIKRQKLFLDRLYSTFNNLDLGGQFNDEKDEWIEMFIGMYKYSKHRSLEYLEKLFEGFAIEKLSLIKEAATRSDFTAPVVVCTQKDNYVYLKEFIPYYRKMGVKHFVFIDNNSTDGSLAFLKMQEDVTLFSAPYSFNGMKKAGWKLQTLAYLGLNHWCLWLDADEFLVYPEMETVNIGIYVETLKNKGIENVGGFMLDMYPSYKFFDESERPDNFYNDYVYFDGDSDSYRLINGTLRGGMRGRCLNIYNLRLDKTPIVYYTKNNFPDGNHTTFPRRSHLIDYYGCVLKHYKFLSSDKKKYQEFAKKGSGYWDAATQKKYLNLTNQTVLDNTSVIYKNSESLAVFPFVKNFLKESL